MTDVAAARAALVELVGASDAPVDPPACYVFSNGTDMSRLGGTGVAWGFRVTCAVGYGGDDATASQDLAELLGAKLALLNDPSTWAIASVSSDQVRTIAGGEQLTADIAVTTKVDI